MSLLSQLDFKPQALLVDLDGTLYRPLGVKLAMGAELLLSGRKVLPILRAFRREHEHLRESLQADPALELVPSPWAVQLKRCAEELGLPVETVTQVVQEWMFERPLPWLSRSARSSLLRELGSFRNQGGRLGLVSDYPARRKLEALGLDGLFEVVVASGEFPGLRRLKPSPDGYLAAAEALDVAPQACLVLGDREDADGEAARRAGMHFYKV